MEELKNQIIHKTIELVQLNAEINEIHARKKDLEKELKAIYESLKQFTARGEVLYESETPSVSHPTDSSPIT